MGFIKQVVTGIGKGVASIFTGGRSGGGGGGQAQPAAAPAPQSAPRSLFQRMREKDPMFMGRYYPSRDRLVASLGEKLGIGRGGTALGLPSGGGGIGKAMIPTNMPTALGLPSGGGGIGGMGQTGMGGMGSFGGMPQSPMMSSSPMPSAPNGGQSFYGGASNSVLDRMRMLRQGMGSPMGMGMPYGGIRRSPFGMM